MNKQPTEYWQVTRKKTQVLGEQPVPVPHYPPQIPYKVA